MKLTEKAHEAIKKAALVEGRTEEQMLYLLLSEGFRFYWMDKNEAQFSHYVDFNPDEISGELDSHAFAISPNCKNDS